MKMRVTFGQLILSLHGTEGFIGSESQGAQEEESCRGIGEVSITAGCFWKECHGLRLRGVKLQKREAIHADRPDALTCRKEIQKTIERMPIIIGQALAVL